MPVIAKLEKSDLWHIENQVYFSHNNRSYFSVDSLDFDLNVIVVSRRDCFRNVFPTRAFLHVKQKVCSPNEKHIQAVGKKGRLIQ
jgi:hypothetical protein